MTAAFHNANTLVGTTWVEVFRLKNDDDTLMALDGYELSLVLLNENSEVLHTFRSGVDPEITINPPTQVVRIAVSPEILAALGIFKLTYRVFLKDTLGTVSLLFHGPLRLEK